MRRPFSVALVVALLAGLVVVSAAEPVIASPVAADEGLYQLYGRVFPDPHGCAAGAPKKSPWAKGDVCAVQFAQWDETLAGLEFLESRFGRYLQVVNLKTMMGDHPAFANEDLQSAGLPMEDLSRDRRDLYVVKVTDRDSPVPEKERKHFAYSLSIHGIERAGLEGGVRAIEDLVTWAACEDDPDNTAPACSKEGPFPKRILEPSDSGPTAGEVLENGVVYFVMANPDGWYRGEYSKGGVFFQRYNGNGMDLNRDWASIGYTEAQYTPFSEPESRGYAKYLEFVKDRTAEGRFAGAIDLHGMLTARSFSFTLLGAGQRDYRKNALTVDTSITTFRDSEKRLSWSPLIAPSGECPGETQEPVFGGNVPMCSDQWGTVWDTINYQVTGSFGDWMDSPLGLDAVGIDNEMALSHLTPNNYFDADIEQLHIDGNKGLVYAQIASLLFEEPVEFRPGGKTAYVFDPERISHPGGAAADGGLGDLPTQDDIRHTELNGIQEFRFNVKGPDDGVHNGGLAIEATFGNIRGVSSNTAGTLVLERWDEGEHVGDKPGWVEVARYFNQSFIYLQAGARIDLNDPKPGTYRIRPNGIRALPTEYHVTFSRDKSYPQPDQAPYDASRMDFFSDLNRYAPADSKLASLTVDAILSDPDVLNRYDSVVVAGEFMPGHAADGSGTYGDADLAAYASALAGFAKNGGNLVLTDEALKGLPALGSGIDPAAVKGGFFYAGWIDFNDGSGPTYDRHHLAAAVNKEGTAEGMDRVDGQDFENRHQTYEPTPLGFYVSPGGSGNRRCTSDRCDSPNWIVDQTAWEAVGGTTAGRTLARVNTTRSSRSFTGTSLGELPFGEGVIRIAGALLPDPSEANFHPYGLASYALTYTGYQVVENSLVWENPNRIDVSYGVDLACSVCTFDAKRRRTVTDTLTVTNTGTVTDRYSLTLTTVPQGWSASVDPSSLRLTRGTSGDSTLSVTPPRNARKGSYQITVEARSEGDPTVTDVVTVTVHI